MPDTPLLDQIRTPRDLKALPQDQLRQVADELRAETIDAVSVTGGHLGAGLGVVELTVALHYLFDAPADKIVWDVGHQAYPHKILTGRRDRIRTLRQGGGLSGFTKRSESEYDPFGAAHASTSISAALGFSVARDLQGGDNRVIAVVGDGAMTGGMAFEALNNAGAMANKLIVVLNDNDMSIAPPVGALSGYLSRLISSKSYRSLRDIGRNMSERFPRPMKKAAQRAEEYARGMLTGGTLFEEFGFYYVGPIDGHDLDHLIPVLRNARDDEAEGPVLVHVVTQKGKGYDPAERSDDKYHGVARFNVATGTQAKGAGGAPSYTRVFADSLIREARRDDKIVAITAAMPSGTGVDLFREAFPERAFDVGLAEQHAVTFAAGLAAEGMKPFAAIYSTFLQRAFDQIVHDVAIQSLPVRFAMDRAGFVGADGQTHCGAFDVAYMGCLPGMVVMAAADEAELARMVATAAAIDDRPSAFRYPRGAGTGAEVPERPEPLPLGEGRVLREGTRIALLSYGARLGDCLDAAAALDARGLSTTVADARFAKPLDEDLVLRLAAGHEALVTVEEGAVGGFASQVAHALALAGAFDAGLRFTPWSCPTPFSTTTTRGGRWRRRASPRPTSSRRRCGRWGATARRPRFARADAGGPGRQPHCARCSSAWSARTQAIIASPTGTPRMPTQGSCRPLVAISAFSPRIVTVRRGTGIELVGLTANRTTMSWPVEIPPRTPPAWFDRNAGSPASIRISSAFSSPVSAAAPNPAPISTPLTALMLIIAAARSASSLPWTGAPSPGGTPEATTSTTAPTELPRLRTSSR